MKQAIRIRDRAIRRSGELLKQIERAKNQCDAKAADGPSSRSHAASEAGMSDRQKKTALRVASVPADDFEAMVESQTPPTVTALAAFFQSVSKGNRRPGHFSPILGVRPVHAGLVRSGVVQPPRWEPLLWSHCYREAQWGTGVHMLRLVHEVGAQDSVYVSIC